jgi:hypothetical protein
LRVSSIAVSTFSLPVVRRNTNDSAWATENDDAPCSTSHDTAEPTSAQRFMRKPPKANASKRLWRRLVGRDYHIARATKTTRLATAAAWPVQPK